MRALCCSLLLLTACDETTNPVPTPGGSWASYGRDHENTRSNLEETAITVSTVTSLAERWRFPMAGCTATPIVVDHTVYIGDWEGNVHALDADSGAAKWTVKVAEYPIDATPLVVGERLYVGDGNGVFYALDRASGAVAWQVLLDEHPSTHIFSSAGAVEGLVLVGVASTELVGIKDDYTFRGSLVALDAESGDERWRVYMTDDDGQSGAGVSVWSSVAIDEGRGMAFIGTGQTYEAPASLRADGIVAVDYRSGDLQWVRQFTEDDVYTIFQEAPQGPDADVGAAPNLFTVDGQDLVGVGDKAGVYSALDRDTGETVWSVMLTPGSHLGGVMTSAAFADGVIYVTSNHFMGEIVQDSLDAPDPANTHTTIALDAGSGEELWRVEQPYPSVGGMLYAGGVVYHGSVDGNFHALDAETGEELWTPDPVSGIASGSSLVDGQLLVSYGFRFFTGTGPVDGGLIAYGP